MCACWLQVDKPVGAEAYICPHVGGYKLQGGQVQPFPQATAGPIMLVSLHVYASSHTCLKVLTKARDQGQVTSTDLPLHTFAALYWAKAF